MHFSRLNPMLLAALAAPSPAMDVVGSPYAVGAYGPQIVGAYGPQIVGAMPAGPALAARRGGMVMHHAPMAVQQGPYAGGGPSLVQSAPEQVRELFIGFGPTTVNANTTALFTAQPQVIFRGSRLVIPAALANAFTVNDIKVGKDSQAAAAGSAPAATFSELGVGVALGLDTASPGIVISLSISNITNANASFQATLIGTTVQ